MKNLSKYSLDELLSLPNEQILSKWSVFASFIRLHENGEQKLKDWGKKWHKAREKAIELLKSEKAEEYLNKARLHREAASQTLDLVPEEPTIHTPARKSKLRKRSVYEKNYEGLLKLIPNLEQLIIDDVCDSAYASTVGFPGYLVCTISTMYDNKNVGIVQFHHFMRDSNAFYVELEMEIKVDIVHTTAEVLHYRTNEEESSVYHRKEGIEEELVDLRQQKRLNKILFDWLSSSGSYKHRFIWSETKEGNTELINKLMGSSFCYAPREHNEYTEQLKQELADLKEKTRQKTKKITRKQQSIKDNLQFLEWNEQNRKAKEQRERILQQQKELEILKNPNRHIPEFEIGKVELTIAHKIIGIRQEDIDAINSTGRLVWLVCQGKNPNGITHIQLLPNGKVRLGLLSNRKS